MRKLLTYLFVISVFGAIWILAAEVTVLSLKVENIERVCDENSLTIFSEMAKFRAGIKALEPKKRWFLWRIFP